VADILVEFRSSFSKIRHGLRLRAYAAIRQHARRHTRLREAKQFRYEAIARRICLRMENHRSSDVRNVHWVNAIRPPHNGVER